MQDHYRFVERSEKVYQSLDEGEGRGLWLGPALAFALVFWGGIFAWWWFR